MKSSTNAVIARVLIVVAGVLLLVGLQLAFQPANAASDLVPFPTPVFPFFPIFIPTPIPSPSISPTPTITPELILEDSPRITPTPTPSATPTPTPTPESDATGGEGDETDCCPGQEEPEPVSTPKVPRVAAAKTKTASVAITEFPSTGFSWPVPVIAGMAVDALAFVWAFKNR